MSQDFTNLSYHETRINGNHNILGDVANETSFPYNSSTQNMPILDSSYLSFLECLQGSTSTFVKEETKPLLEVEEAKAIIVVESEILTTMTPPISSISSLSYEVNALQKEDLSKTMKQENHVENFAYDGGENPTNKE
ncbi:hypothetical protein LIER_03736 [Lithospermum erythrorhizon]|uniref:Uncharacterized protein n=1 Tax=Lithospermum erythrorhizon TaxID=34254 RepID=A0AAV3NU94_LITER